MLVLTRYIGQSIIIGENMDIEVKFLGFNGNQMKIGISAPDNVPIHREEIANRIIMERKYFKTDIIEQDSIISESKIY
jgi:carbon storage regulator